MGGFVGVREWVHRCVNKHLSDCPMQSPYGTAEGKGIDAQLYTWLVL